MTADAGAVARSTADLPTEQPTRTVPTVNSNLRQTAPPPSRVIPVRTAIKTE